LAELPKLLITGFNGTIGKILWRNLADSFELYGLDLSLDREEENTFQADISNFEQVTAAFEHMPSLAYVVHLAGDPSPEADWQSVLLNNIHGTRNVYEAAQTHGVKRVVFASSNHVAGGYEGFPPELHNQDDPPLISPSDPVRPDGYYGVGKVAGEAIARMYYELYGLESVCLRIGAVLEDDDPTQDARNESIWLSHVDLVQLVRKSLLAEVKFSIYYGVSNNKKRFFDFSNAAAEIGYQPESDASAV
jgi:NAD+ dependent glucose-6-phosphate dehydrogenase